ncbi:hypothetical protein [Pseudodesulfovibrio sediminis]|uniref:Uncharacterized protein n=1 Tax=Pseudodesulfovibrio sediminis TaxID=2810563 RepID=A0ABM7P761_9BACT|nr:hypothetical protein [Pseudodesulfovibrio sediminis]BCS88802.1 hypothetical protein PSDVSF_20440 [Pseudodesulfovibrio sediminis]
MCHDRLNIIFKLKSVLSETLLNRFYDVLRKFELLPKQVHTLNGNLTLNKSLQFAKRRGARGLHISTKTMEIRTGNVANWDHQFLSIKHHTNPNAVPWSDWIKAFSAFEGFLQGWIVNCEYNKWQNCEDLEEHARVGRDLSLFSIIPNSLHQPAPPLIIDITKNPGRRTIRKGLVESVGAEMWFGSEFWERSGANKDEVLGIDWADVNKETDGIVHIKAADTPFTDESPVAIQHRLRKLLFPTTWNIPVQWSKWDGWKPVDLPTEKTDDGYYLVSPQAEMNESFPIVIEIAGEKGGKQGRFRITRTSQTDSETIFIPNKQNMDT